MQALYLVEDLVRFCINKQIHNVTRQWTDLKITGHGRLLIPKQALSHQMPSSSR